jgi:hypothetical protein
LRLIAGIRRSLAKKGARSPRENKKNQNIVLDSQKIRTNESEIVLENLLCNLKLFYTNKGLFIYSPADLYLFFHIAEEESSDT